VKILTTGKGEGTKEIAFIIFSIPRTIIKQISIILHPFPHVVGRNTSAGVFEITVCLHVLLFHAEPNFSKILQRAETTLAIMQLMNT